MSEAAAPAPSTDWGALYLTIGRVLGALAGFITFVGSWIYCVAHYGFLIGVCVGWLPGLICGAIVGALTCYLWGPMAIGAAAIAIQLNKPEPPSSTSAAAYNVTATDAAATAAAMADDPIIPEVPAPVAAPSSADVTAAISDFWRVFKQTGMAGAVIQSSDCYAKLSASPTWSGWDRCAAFDHYAQGVDAAATRQMNYPATEYFSEIAISSRRTKAAYGISSDWQANQDRALALKAVINGVVSAQIARAQAAEVAAAGGASNPGPSFDCSKVTSHVLKLVCDTPSLAEADRNLAAAYQAARARSPSPETLQESQVAWINIRNSGEADEARLASMYAERTAQLQALYVGE